MPFLARRGVKEGKSGGSMGRHALQTKSWPSRAGHLDALADLLGEQDSSWGRR